MAETTRRGVLGDTRVQTDSLAATLRGDASVGFAMAAGMTTVLPKTITSFCLRPEVLSHHSSKEVLQAGPCPASAQPLQVSLSQPSRSCLAFSL